MFTGVCFIVRYIDLYGYHLSPLNCYVSIYGILYHYMLYSCLYLFIWLYMGFCLYLVYTCFIGFCGFRKYRASNVKVMLKLIFIVVISKLRCIIVSVLTKTLFTMTIYEIKNRTLETSPHFFDTKSLKFFGQTMKSFKVYKQDDGRYLITAPMIDKTNGRNMGQTERYFNPINNELERS